MINKHSLTGQQIRFRFLNPNGTGTFLRAYCGERATANQAVWQQEEQWELLRYIGTEEGAAHVYQNMYILEQDIEIPSENDFHRLQLAARRKISGTWDDGTISYTNVIIDTFDVPDRVRCADIWRGSIVWRRLRG